MKKFFIPILILFSFFFVANVNAFTFDYDNYNISNTDIDNVNKVIDYLNDNTTKSYNIIKVSTGYEVLFFNNDSSNVGNWYLISDKSSSNYYFAQYGYGVLDSNNKISQNNYSNMIQDRSSSSSQPPILPFNATETQLNTYLTSLDDVINSTYYGSSVIFYNRFYRTDITVNSTNNIGYPLYTSFDLPLVSRNLSGMSFNTSSIIYNEETTQLNNLDLFIPYFNALNSSSILINKVIDLENNTFGFYQNMLSLNLTSLSGPVDTLSIICEENRFFDNNYCNLNYNDLVSHNSDISVFNNYGSSFTQLYGKNTGYLYNDYYYLYSFRILKPFVPQVGNIFINTLKGTSSQVNILGVYLQDAGSYTDYVVKFKIVNTNYDSDTNLNDIMVVFRDGLNSYYSTIPTSFNYGVYRSFKLQYFDTEPTMTDVNDFYNYRDLSTINGINGQSSFFTDTDFDSFGFGGIVTAPFRFLYALENYNSCSDIVLPFPHSNGNFTLKCVRQSIPSSLNPLIVILQVVLSGIVCYRVAVGVLKVIKDLSSPEDSSIEVVDL